MEEGRRNNKVWVTEEESTVDWRGRPSNPNKHGGMRAAAFVLGLFSFSPTPIPFSFFNY